MKILFAFLSLLLLIPGYGQVTEGSVNKEKVKVQQFNIIKIGTSVRGEAYSHYDIYYDPYYYHDGDDYQGGYNIPVFVSYEHIWQYGDKIAFGIEPMLGVSFRKNLTSFFAGTEFKLYWANKSFWRMGISFNPSYTYGERETSRWISMDDGAYQKMIDVKLHYNIFSFDPALIPFQFRIKNSPVIIESLITLIGFNVVTKSTGPYETWENETTKITSTDPHPYFFKYELKIGIVLP